MMDKKLKPLKTMTKEQILEMEYNSAPKMVKVGSLYGCTLWAEIDQHRHPQDRWRVYQLIMKTLKNAFGVPDEKND
jgi:hypothetical protein